jgi:hypothetical protein
MEVEALCMIGAFLKKAKRRNYSGVRKIPSQQPKGLERKTLLVSFIQTATAKQNQERL